jgi:hypothetical protein
MLRTKVVSEMGSVTWTFLLAAMVLGPFLVVERRRAQLEEFGPGNMTA